MRTSLGPLTFDLMAGWADVTNDIVDVESPPLTFARQGAGASGAFQVSTAVFRDGDLPQLNGAQLAEMLTELAHEHDLGIALTSTVEELPLALASALFSSGESVVAVWYVSDTASLAKVTYTASVHCPYDCELQDCEEMVRSIRFAYSDRST